MSLSVRNNHITYTNGSHRTASTVASSPPEVHTLRVTSRKLQDHQHLSLSPSLSKDERYYRAVISPGRSSDTCWDMLTHYVDCDLVGKGSYGEVVRARDISSYGPESCGTSIKPPLDLFVAIKKVEIFENDNCGDWENGLRLLREVYFLKRLQHPRIAKLRGLFPNNPRMDNAARIGLARFTTLSIVTEFYNKGALSEYQVKSSREAVGIMYQILDGLAYLHQNGILHRDIKRENIFIRLGELASENSSTIPRVVIGDFGLSRSMVRGAGPSACMTSEVVTKPYRCPSLLLGRTVYGAEIDIYAAGIIFMEMLVCKRNSTLLPNKKMGLKNFLKHQFCLAKNGITSFSAEPEMIDLCTAMHLDIDELVSEINSNHCSVSEWACKIWKTVPTELHGMIECMVHVNPLQRPSAADLLKLNVFDSIRRLCETVIRRPVQVSECFDDKISPLANDTLRAAAVKREIWNIMAEVDPYWKKQGFTHWFPGEDILSDEPVSKRTRLSLKTHSFQ